MAQQTAVEAPAEDIEDLVDELPPGTKLLKGQYTIVRYLNSGGFGITYLAKDSLDRNVVIKECFPSTVCRRSKTVVAARSRAHTAELRSVVQLFVSEARHLSKIVHPNIVAVHQVFEDYGTAYMAIDYVDGLDLQQIIEGQGRTPGPDEIVLMTEKLLAAVGFIHAHDMLHRDISPDNVLLDHRGEPILIDFGAAREQASQKSRAMSALRVVKDGYSPQEFYIAGSEQGPWSDLYALGATLFHLISGEAPINGQARLSALAENRSDPYLPLEGRVKGYPPGFLRAIDTALCTLPRQRVQSAQEWFEMFRPGIQLPLSPNEDIAAAVHAMVVRSRTEASPPPAVALVPAAPPAGDSYVPPESVRQVSQAQPMAEVAAKRGMAPVQVVAGVAAALALVGAGIMLMGGNDTPSPVKEAAAAIAAPAPESTTGAAPATAAEPASEPAPELAAESAPEPGVEPAATSIAVAPEAEPETAEATVPTAEVASVTAPVVEAAAATPAMGVTETVPAAPAPVVEAVVLAESQIAFAAWDAAMPFMEDNRMIGGQRVAIVARILPSTDLAETGSWLAPGLMLYSVNGVQIQQSGSVTAAVLNAMRVDPDGKARVVVEYSNSSLERQAGLMTVTANRLVSLANGVNVSISTVEGEWKAVVTGVTVPSATDLRQGDILFRDKTTNIALSGPESLEAVIAALVKAERPQTEFSIIRNNKLATAFMRLATETGQ